MTAAGAGRRCNVEVASEHCGGGGYPWAFDELMGEIAMLTGRPSSKETTTLHWQMPDDAWVHWAQGLGEKSVRDVILEGIDQIRKSPEAVRERCKAVVQEAPREHEVGQLLKHEIKIELPASDWVEASQRVGPVSTEQLLRALILESESWQQVGNAESEFYAG